MKSSTAKRPRIAASEPRLISSGPSEAPTDRSSRMRTGAGSAPDLSTSARSFASWRISLIGFRPPRWMEQTPPGIGPWMMGAESTESSSTMAMRFFTLAVVSFSNRSAPVRLKLTCT